MTLMTLRMTLMTVNRGSGRQSRLRTVSRARDGQSSQGRSVEPGTINRGQAGSIEAKQDQSRPSWTNRGSAGPIEAQLDQSRLSRVSRGSAGSVEAQQGQDGQARTRTGRPGPGRAGQDQYTLDVHTRQYTTLGTLLPCPPYYPGPWSLDRTVPMTECRMTFSGFSFTIFDVQFEVNLMSDLRSIRCPI